MEEDVPAGTRAGRRDRALECDQAAIARDGRTAGAAELMRRVEDSEDVAIGAMVQYHVVDAEQAAVVVSDCRSVMQLIATMILAKTIAEFDSRCWRHEQDTIVACLEHGIRKQSGLHGMEVISVRLLDVRVPAVENNSSVLERDRTYQGLDRAFTA